MPELTIADELEFESWPEEMQQLASMYFSISRRRPRDGYIDEKPRIFPSKPATDPFGLYYDMGFKAGVEFALRKP